MVRVTIRRNRLPQARQMIRERLQERLEKAAHELRAELQQKLAGDLPLQSDTTALAESLYVQTPGGSDYQEAYRKAAAAYTSHDSYWREQVRQLLSVQAYTAEHLEERRADEDALPDLAGAPIVAVATMLAYGYLWEYGHFNVFTGQYEHRPWFEDTCRAWMLAKMARYFENIIR